MSMLSDYHAKNIKTTLQHLLLYYYFILHCSINACLYYLVEMLQQNKCHNVNNVNIPLLDKVAPGKIGKSSSKLAFRDS